MDNRLSFLIKWPDRRTLSMTMPKCFLDSYGCKVTVIIDCFEIPIERPSNLIARACTWSSYKNHNTVKFLIGISPQGTITFISKAWGGRVSDRYITQYCGILDKLQPGDLILADRGFNIKDLVQKRDADINIPIINRSRRQITATSVLTNRKISNLRIHVERIISRIKTTFTILIGNASHNLLATGCNNDQPLIDRILRICCAICNLSPSIVSFN